ncbi:hypothetical protein CF327_g931 [Tilletia walkeri]|nr:hypothetical protein CF327_g931 [Tilletia walkeri]
MAEPIHIPARAVVLPLPYPLVLHPGLMLNIPQSYSQSLSLLKAALQVADASPGNNNSNRSPADRPIVVVCVPTLRTPPHVQPPSPTRALPSPPANSSNAGHGDIVQPVRINDLFDWGVAARLLRLTRHPATQSCTLLVTGLQRVRVDRWLSIKAPLTTSALDKNNSLTVPDIPVPLAAITPFKDPLSGWPAASDSPSHQTAASSKQERERDVETVRQFREAAFCLLDAIAQLNPVQTISSSNEPVDKTKPQTNPDPIAPPTPALPILPPALLKRIRAFVKDATRPDHSAFPVSASAAADVLIGTLGGACPWASRVSLLSEWDPRQRVRAATALLIEGTHRVKTARELFSSLSAPLNKSAKETLARSQLEALLNQLAALNPNISAKVTTGNTTFSIGSASDDKDGDKDKGNFGIITIRQPQRGEDDDANKNNNKSSIVIRGNLPGFGARSRGNPGAGPFDGPPSGASLGGGGRDDNEEEDELAEIRRKLDEASLSPEARKVCDRELKRLARIPPQSVERGVLVSYLEVMAELPWERVSAEVAPEKLRIGRDAEDSQRARKSIRDGEGLVERARRILDEDHYGLDKIKKRLVEYLAVLELKTMQADEQMAEEEAAAVAAASAKAGEGGNNPSGASSRGEGLQSGGHDDDGFQHLEDIAEEQRESRVQKDRDTLERERAKKRRKAASVKDKGPILLLVGPPGVGKTSIARSLATALQRPLTRLSLGGVRDEAEIRGHRRTYVGAMAGAIASSLRKVGVSDPVLLLDEIDKLGSGNGMHGDPMAAMLEVLDPEQNHAFVDHYINCPIDLSRVLFIATANSLDTISPPLLDRTEVIYVSGYTIDEKIAIARSYLLPKQVKAQGLKPQHVEISDEVLSKIASSYTREAGVRSLEREIGSVARAKAVEFAEARKGVKDEQGKKKVYDPVVTLADVERILGVETYEPEVADLQARPGVATGLAYQGSGNGGVLFIETAMLPPGSGNVKLTGSLGDVIRESAELAISWIKANSFLLGITSTRESEFPKNDLHVHFPSGAVSKDGPSAGIAITCALVGLFTRTAIDPKLAMTGEITLRGQVTPVGGIKEKVLGAHRAGITKILLPYRNRKDVEADLPAKIKADVEIVYIKTMWQALDAAFGHALFEHVVGHHEGVEEGRKRMMEIVEEHRL